MASSWQKLRSDFPITRRAVYLDHASGGPLPRPVEEKIRKYYQEHLLKADLSWGRWIERREDVRRRVARFINADSSEVTFISSTSQGMNFIAELLASRGTVLTNSSEFPSSTVPWLWRKAKVVFQKSEQNKICLKRLKSLLSPSVKTIVSSFIQYSSGFRQDMESLGKMKSGRFLAVNATQGFGAFPVDVQKWKADFLCTNSYKWLMAGYGGGGLYIRKKWLSQLRPAGAGWRSMKNPEQMNNRLLDIRADAGRYEWGCPSFPAIFAVGAAVEYLSGIGMQRISKRILDITKFARERLEEKGFEVISPREEKHRSGILVFKVNHSQEVCRKLLRQGVYVSPRGEGIRIAPHFYNQFEDIDILIKHLIKIVK